MRTYFVSTHSNSHYYSTWFDLSKYLRVQNEIPINISYSDEFEPTTWKRNFGISSVNVVLFLSPLWRNCIIRPRIFMTLSSELYLFETDAAAADQIRLDSYFIDRGISANCSYWKYIIRTRSDLLIAIFFLKGNLITMCVWNNPITSSLRHFLHSVSLLSNAILRMWMWTTYIIS